MSLLIDKTIMFNYEKIEKKFVNCDLCGANDYTILFKGDRYNMGLTTVSCNNCGLIYTNPRPQKNFMDDFYKNYYRMYYESITAPDCKYVQQGEIKERSNFITNAIWPYLKKYQFVNILDIGCAEGSVLYAIQKKCVTNNISYKLVGIEPSKSFSNFAKKYTDAFIFTGTLEEYYHNYNKQIEGFDFIIMNHVLEHFLSPSTQLRLVWSLLKENGYLYIAVPDILADWSNKSMIHIAHLYNFSIYTLKNILEKNGFIVIKTDFEGRDPFPYPLNALCRKGNSFDTQFLSKNQIKQFNKKIINNFYKKSSIQLTKKNNITSFTIKPLIFFKKIVKNYIKK